MAHKNKRFTEYPGLLITRLASGAVTTRRFVKNYGTPGVGKMCDTLGEFAIGVAMDGADSGKSVAVCVDGIVLVEAGQIITQNEPVATSAIGKAQPAVKNQYIIGVAMETCEAGDLVPILLGTKKLELVRTTTTTTTTSSTTTTSTTTTTAP